MNTESIVHTGNIHDTPQEIEGGILDGDYISIEEKINLILKENLKSEELKKITVEDEQYKKEFIENLKDVSGKKGIMFSEQKLEDAYYITLFENALGQDNQYDLNELRTLVIDSQKTISWGKLWKYTKIIDNKVEGIYWKGDLDICNTQLSTLWKIKHITGNLILTENRYLKNIESLKFIMCDIYLIFTSFDLQLSFLKKKINKTLLIGGEWKFSDFFEKNGDLLLTLSNEDLKAINSSDTWERNFFNLCKQKVGKELGEDSEDFKGLISLVHESHNKIKWDKLLQYTRIVDGKIEGIYWNEDLDLSNTRIESLRNIKKVKGKLNCNHCFYLKDFGDFKHASNGLSLKGERSFMLSLKVLQNICTGYFQKDIEYDLDIKIMKYKNIFQNLSYDQLERFKVHENIFVEILEEIFEEEMNKQLGEGSEDLGYLLDLIKQPGTSITKYKIFEYTKIENGYIESIEWEGNLNLFGGIQNLDISKFTKIAGDVNCDDADIKLYLKFIKAKIYGEIEIDGEISYKGPDELIAKIYKKILFLSLYLIKGFDCNRYLEEDIFPVIGTSEEYPQEIKEILDMIGIWMIKHYIGSVEKYMSTPDLDLGDDEIQKIMEDREEKNTFFRKLFGNELVKKVWEDNNNNN